MADPDLASAARPSPTKDELLAQAQENAETIANLYRDRIEAAQRLPDPQRCERLAEIQRIIRDQTNAINRPLVDMLMRLPPDPIVVQTETLRNLGDER